jgi:hypothetical protein
MLIDRNIDINNNDNITHSTALHLSSKNGHQNIVQMLLDHGIIIDYYSTDRSIDIIRTFCPTWTIVKTKNINSNGTPNFDALLIDQEVNEIEKTIKEYKICLNITEFFIILNEEFLTNVIHRIPIYSMMSTNNNPKNIVDFLKVDLFKLRSTPNIQFDRGYRTLHNKDFIHYHPGRHYIHDGQGDTIQSTDFIILWSELYPFNEKFIERKLQIKNNMSQRDKQCGNGFQHLMLEDELHDYFHKELSQHTNELKLKLPIKSSIYYSELLMDSHWGEDFVMLDQDINLLKNTDFDNTGYKIVDIETNELQDFIRNEIKTLTQKDVENYHEITEEDHKKVLNAMPYKKEQLKEVSDYLEQYVSNLLQEDVKIFNDDIWVRICRPSNLCDTDYNPCHKDVYLSFYRNMVNIYVPLFGSDENSSLKLQPGSHKWNEKDTMVTKGGVYFKHTNKKYSVDAIVSSKVPLDMIRPNPKENQMMIFSPYLIHGCAENENNITRISLEVRFIRKNNIKQEEDFKEFLKTRIWR